MPAGGSEEEEDIEEDEIMSMALKKLESFKDSAAVDSKAGSNKSQGKAKNKKTVPKKEAKDAE